MTQGAESITANQAKEMLIDVTFLRISKPLLHALPNGQYILYLAPEEADSRHYAFWATADRKALGDVVGKIELTNEQIVHLINNSHTFQRIKRK